MDLVPFYFSISNLLKPEWGNEHERDLGFDSLLKQDYVCNKDDVPERLLQKSDVFGCGVTFNKWILFLDPEFFTYKLKKLQKNNLCALFHFPNNL